MVQRLLKRQERKRILKTSVIASLISLAVSTLGTISLGNARIAMLNAAIGLFVGFTAPLSIQFLLGSLRDNARSRSLPRIAVFAIYMIVTTIVVSILCLVAVLGLGTIADQGLPGKSELIASVEISLIIAFTLALVLNVYALLTEYLGRNFFGELLLGRYGTPHAEERAVAFVDLVGSTSLAETLGPQRFFEVLNRFLGAVETIAIYSGGSVHKYVGDCVIITWKLPAAASRPLDFLRLLRDEMSALRTELRSRYGVEPRFTAGLHAGTLLLGEIGSERKELGYWGDTMNTTQRIQDSCKRANALALVSAEYLEAAGPLPPALAELRLARLDGVVLKGKRESRVLYALR